MRTRIASLVIFNLLILFNSSIFSQEIAQLNCGEAIEEEEKSDDPSTQDRVKTNWLISRETASLNGLDVTLDYTGELWSNASGGYNQANDYLHNIDLIFYFDLEKLINWKGATFNTYILGNYGGFPSEASGTAQGISNIEAYNTWKLYEFWLQQNLFDDKLSLLLGLFDLNSEFDTRETSSLFINPSHGIGPDIAQICETGPSIFPVTALAFRVDYKPIENVFIKAAVFEGEAGDPDNPNGTRIKLKDEHSVLLTTEVGYTTNAETFGKGYSKIALGAWLHTDDYQLLEQPVSLSSPLSKKGNKGFYISAEKFLYSEAFDDEQGLAGFIRTGVADDEINAFDFYLGTGVTYKGFFSGRENDVIGLAFAYAHNGDPFIRSMAKDGVQVKKYELDIELTYSFEVGSWFVIQPDIQYVINPSTVRGVNNALVFGTRVSLSF